VSPAAGRATPPTASSTSTRWVRPRTSTTPPTRQRRSRIGLTNLKTLEIQSAFNGRRLCENTVGRLEEKGVTYWSDAGAVDKLEWFQGIRTVTASYTDYQVQESLHPDYFAQEALRNCIRQAYNAGTPRGGTCTHGTGLSSRGEPNMTLG
jgi:hypothetical protein